MSKNEKDIKIYKPKETEAGKKNKFIKSLYLYITIFFTCFIVLILVAYIGQVKQSKMLLADKDASIKATQSLKQNVQNENIALKKKISEIESKMATIEKQNEEYKKTIENCQKQITNSQMLEDGIYNYYNRNRTKAKEILTKIEKEYLNDSGKQQLAELKKKLRIKDEATPEAASEKK